MTPLKFHLSWKYLYKCIVYDQWFLSTISRNYFPFIWINKNYKGFQRTLCHAWNCCCQSESVMLIVKSEVHLTVRYRLFFYHQMFSIRIQIMIKVIFLNFFWQIVADKINRSDRFKSDFDTWLRNVHRILNYAIINMSNIHSG